jgi:hypothetical protein
MRWVFCRGVVALGSLLCFSPLLAQKLEAPAWFVDGTERSGLAAFTLVSGTPEKRYIMEAMAGGLCLLDYDGDGWLDIYLVNGGRTENFRRGEPSGLLNALFRNQGDRTFRDVTAGAGVGGNGSWGYGCSVVDYDNDGRPDIYVTNYGPNLLYHNLGGGRFEEVAAKAGVADTRWSAGSAWADYDLDGHPDLFVANYLELDKKKLPEPGSAGYGSMAGNTCTYRGVEVMCGPRGLPGAGDSLYHNNGDGTFSEVGKAAGVNDPGASPGLGAVWCDLDDDGRPDLYVANDSTPNFLYRNRGDGRFEETGMLSGVAVGSFGQFQAGMGVACADYNGDGRLDLYVTNFSEDVNTLYRNEGGMNFSDVTFRAGLATPTIPFVGWGTFFFDFDNDGWLDLFVANGHVYPQMDKVPGSIAYREHNQLFHNTGGDRFVELSAETLGLAAAVSRGAAWGDLDNDGALDLVVARLDASPAVLWNETGSRGNFLTLTLAGSRSGRQALGARVRLRTGTRWQTREVISGDSYLSASDPRIQFGLGTHAQADEIEIRWPSGSKTIIRGIAAGQFLTVREPEPAATPAATTK